jgi:hypothetical protein
MKILSAILDFHVDGKTDMAKLTAAFLPLLVANTPKKGWSSLDVEQGPN